MKISQKSFTVFNWQTIQKCQLFIETPGIVRNLGLMKQKNIVLNCCKFCVLCLSCFVYSYSSKIFNT